MMQFWKIKPDWSGQSAFVIGGGPSVRHLDLEQLRGQRVVAINSSYDRVPWADLLFFADKRWWEEEHAPFVPKIFKGPVATVSMGARGNLLRLRRAPVSVGLAEATDTVTYEATKTIACSSLQAVLNILYHKRVSKIVLVGFDMARAADGSTHHHKPHPWPNRPGNRSWDLQMKQLQHIVQPLADVGIEVRVANPYSRLTFWPRITFEEAIKWARPTAENTTA